jgi:hypothetical protein
VSERRFGAERRVSQPAHAPFGVGERRTRVFGRRLSDQPF